MKFVNCVATTALVVLSVVAVLDSKAVASIYYSLILRRATRRVSRRRPRTTRRSAAEV